MGDQSKDSKKEVYYVVKKELTTTNLFTGYPITLLKSFIVYRLLELQGAIFATYNNRDVGFILNDVQVSKHLKEIKDIRAVRLLYGPKV